MVETSGVDWLFNGCSNSTPRWGGRNKKEIFFFFEKYLRLNKLKINLNRKSCQNTYRKLNISYRGYKYRLFLKGTEVEGSTESIEEESGWFESGWFEVRRSP